MPKRALFTMSYLSTIPAFNFSKHIPGKSMTSGCELLTVTALASIMRKGD